MRIIRTPTNHIQLAVSIIFPASVFPLVTVSLHIFIDTPEAVPGSLIGPSESDVPSGSATPASSFDPSSSGSPPPLPGGGGPNGLAIAGGVIGGFAGIAIVIAVIYRLQRNSQALSSASAGVGASRSQQPRSNDVVPPLSSGSSMTMELHVRDFVPALCLCVLMWSRSSYFRPPRIRMTQLLRSQGTRVVCRCRT